MDVGTLADMREGLATARLLTDHPADMTADDWRDLAAMFRFYARDADQEATDLSGQGHVCLEVIPERDLLTA